MATFTWQDILTVTVGEMSRAQALDCARQFQTLSRVYTDVDELMVEADVTGVLYAPVVVKLYGNLLDPGPHVITLADDVDFTLTLPLTHEAFNVLPMSLAQLWITAMVQSNGWLIDLLKKVSSLTTENGSGPKSDDAQSNEPKVEALTTPTIG